jgi:hypothetical protein
MHLVLTYSMVRFPQQSSTTTLFRTIYLCTATDFAATIVINIIIVGEICDDGRFLPLIPTSIPSMLKGYVDKFLFFVC